MSIVTLNTSSGQLILLTDKGQLGAELVKCDALPVLFHLCRQITLIQEVKLVQNINKISVSAQKK